MAEIRKDVFGYFENPQDTIATHDPGKDGICLICGKKLEPPVKTISLMKIGDNRSYFYRTHKSCFDTTSPEELIQLESSLIDNV